MTVSECGTDRCRAAVDTKEKAHSPQETITWQRPCMRLPYYAYDQPEIESTPRLNSGDDIRGPAGRRIRAYSHRRRTRQEDDRHDQRTNRSPREGSSARNVRVQAARLHVE